MQQKIQFTLNDEPVEILADGQLKLLWILRTHFGLTGTKYGCGEGACGSCTVLVNEDAVRSCLVQIKDVVGKKVTTIEGLASEGKLHPLQDALIKHDAIQCGYCTPGMIMHAAGLLHKNQQPTRDEIIREMDDNLCRCGSYTRIADAIESAAKIIRENGHGK